MLDKAGNDIEIPHPLNGCFKVQTIERADILESCYAPRPGDPRPAVLLVGDSTAYAIAAGLQQVLGDDYQVLVWTSASCAPLYETEFPREGKCKKNNTEFFENIVHQYKYDLVIFSNTSTWDKVKTDFHRGAEILEQINLDYVLLGQIIAYRDIPLNIMARHGLGHLDETMREKLKISCTGEHGLDGVVPKIKFFSMKNALCENDRPIYSINGRIVQKDKLHLSDVGAVFVAEKLKSWLLENGHLPPKSDDNSSRR